MKLLSIETATAAGASALVVDGEILEEDVATQDRHHTETLLPSAIALLSHAGLKPQDLDGIVIDVGPGLFTGLRVGISTARSLAFAAQVGVYCVSSLSVLANDRQVAESPVVISVVDARRGEVFVQHFSASPSTVSIPLDEPTVMTPEALRETLLVSQEPVTLVGDGAIRFQDRFDDLDWVTVAKVTIPSPGVAGQIVERGGVELISDVERVLPLYLRDPDAVANFSVAAAYDTR